MSQEKQQAAPTFDVKKEYKYLYSPSAKKPEIVDVPAFKYIMVDGKGDPNTSGEFEQTVQLLYGLAYTIRFMLKKDEKEPLVFKVPPLAGLWDAEDMASFTQEGRKDEWQWTLMVLMPDRVTNDVFAQGKEELIKKKNPPLTDRVRFDVYEEGKSAQMMHLGPYKNEGPTIATLHSFLKEQGYTFNGRHHEIYLGDPRKSDPAKLKTIIRQPIKKG
ncbi:MAG: hypothetical protein GY940_29990 [bacterium]|nr:hypothetical protein [bacterium]